MKKKGKTKRIITICITVIMMLGIFIVPSNAATYQPAENYNITTRYKTENLTTYNNTTYGNRIRTNIEFSIKKIFNVSEINAGDIFEYEAEKSLLIWKYGEIYTSTKIKKIDDDEYEGYLFYANENNVLRIALHKSTSETYIGVSNEGDGRISDMYQGYIEYATEDNIEIIQPPPSFVDQTTTGMRTVLGWIALPITALLDGNWNPLLILFAIGIAISGILITIKIVRKFIWGEK